MNERLLLVEDDEALRELVALALERAGMTAETTGTGADALDLVANQPFDLILLDVMLPGMDGFELCRVIRQSSTMPIVMLTAKSDTHDIVTGLECGADDYVTKPFEAAELLARIRAVLRRSTSDEGMRPVRGGPLTIDPAAFTVARDGRPISLTATEFRLLLELARHPRRVLTREALLWRVWHYDYMGDSRLVDMAIKRLRDKIEADGHDPKLIVTVRGIGYRFEPSGEQVSAP